MSSELDKKYGVVGRRRLAAGDVEFSLVDTGDGESVVLLHGYPQSLLMWRHQIPVLGRSFRVVAPDWPGWGESRRSMKVRARYWEEVERIGVLLDALDIEACNLIGHDYGGFLSLGFATRFPERVSRLGIINSRAHRTFPLATYVTFLPICWAGRSPGLRSLAARLPLYEMTRRTLDPYLRNGAFDEDLFEHYAGWMRSSAGRRWLIHFFRYYEMPVRKDLAASLGKVTVPSAVIWGDQDPFCPWSTAEDLARRLSDTELVRLPDVFHYSPEEAPDAVTSAIRNLLARSTTVPATSRSGSR